MNSKEVFMTIHRALSIDNTYFGINSEDISRKLVIHVSRSSGNNNVSHITTEFAGVRAKFFCCLVFDGSGDSGISLQGFAMPKVKLALSQKAIVMLAILEYLTAHGYIDADMNFFKDRVASEFSGGTGNIVQRYEAILKDAQKNVSNLAKNPSSKIYSVTA
jgi:hypothetical protein